MPHNQKETKKLFDSVDSVSKDPKQALEDFKQALQSADVNAFDEEGNTPLICVINTRTEYLNTKTEELSALKEMLTLLTQHKDIDINAQNKAQAYIKQAKTDEKDNPVFLYQGKEIIELCQGGRTMKDRAIITYRYVYYSNRKDVVFEDGDKPCASSYYDAVYEEVKKLDSEGNPVYVGNTALHVAFMSEDEDAISILYTNPDIKDDIKNHEGATPKNIIPSKIKELKDKIQKNLQHMDKSEKSDLEKTIKDLEGKNLRIESQITLIRKDRKSSSDAIVNDEEQNQNHEQSTDSGSQETQVEDKQGYLIETSNNIQNSSQTKNDTVNPKYTAIVMGMVSGLLIAVGISTGALVNPLFFIIAGVGAIVGGFAVYHVCKEAPSELSEPTSAKAEPALVKV